MAIPLPLGICQSTVELAGENLVLPLPPFWLLVGRACPSGS